MGTDTWNSERKDAPDRGRAGRDRNRPASGTVLRRVARTGSTFGSRACSGMAVDGAGDGARAGLHRPVDFHAAPMHDRDPLATSPRERSVAVALTKGAVHVSLMKLVGQHAR